MQQLLHELLPALISVRWEGLKVLLNPVSPALGWLGMRVCTPRLGGCRPHLQRTEGRGPAPLPPPHAEPRPHIARSAEQIPPAPPPLHVPPGH